MKKHHPEKKSTAGPAAAGMVHESERVLRDVQELARIGTWHYDVQQGTLVWSDELYRIFDIDPVKDTLSLDLLFSRIHPEDRDDFRAQVASGLPYRTDYRIVRQDGSEHFIHEEVRIDRDSVGKPVSMYGTAQDITDRKQAESKLREDAHLFRSLAEQSITGVTLVQDDIFLYVNPHFAEIAGCRVTDLIGTSPFDLVEPADRDLVKEEFRKRLTGDPSVARHVFRIRAKDGSPRQLEAHGTVITFRGRPAVMATLLDITERTQLDDTLSFIAQRGWTSRDEEFFPSLVRHLGTTAGMDYVLLARLTDDGLHAETVAVYAHGDIVPNFRYALSGTPCENVAGKTLCSYRSSIQQLFPQDTILVDMKAESYIGIPLWDSTGSPLGLLAVLDGRPLAIAGHIAALLQVVAARVAAELERVKTHARLLDSEARFRALIEQAGDGFELLDKDGRYVDVNQVTCERLGYTRQEMLGMSIFDIDPAIDELRFRSTIDSMVAGEPVTFPSVHRRKDGTTFPVEITTSLVLLGGEAHALALVRDTTERKRAETAMLASEARFRSIIENASEGIMAADEETRRILYANPEICRILGYLPEEFRAFTIAELIAPEERTQSILAFREHANGQQRSAERTFLRKDGSRVRMAITSVRMELDGRPCLVGFLTDITERELLEQERMKTQKLESIGTLAGGIAHDFNNLLQGVFGFISLARMTIDNREKSIAALDQAEQALHRSVSLTTQLLTFAKGGKPVMKATDLKPVIENAARFALSGSRSSAAFSIDPSLWQVDADANQLAQVFQNIVLNADQAMPAGGSVTIAARNLPAGSAELPADRRAKNHVLITIRDTGIGIPNQYLERIFDPYFTTKDKGSGLGLATSYSIIRNHDGLLQVRSELGVGTTFSIYLAALSAAAPNTVATAPSPSTAVRQGRILVMDDEEIVRTVARELFAALGQVVDFALHGGEAIDKYIAARSAGAPYDIVILDLTIRGGMGGLATMKLLREIDPTVKAVVSSGYSDDTAMAAYRQEGFLAFLKKPYDIFELKRTLESLLGSG